MQHGQDQQHRQHQQHGWEDEEATGSRNELAKGTTRKIKT